MWGGRGGVFFIGMVTLGFVFIFLVLAEKCGLCPPFLRRCRYLSKSLVSIQILSVSLNVFNSALLFAFLPARTSLIWNSRQVYSSFELVFGCAV